MLYLIATPIGNLADITFRAVQTLAVCDYVLCEDTRRSRILLSHYELQKPLKSYHKFKEAQMEERVIADLRRGLKLALLSDAGTPTISDPGQRLVARCRREGLCVTALPGSCAAVMALSLSGFDTAPFQFVGFLPAKKTACERALATCLQYEGTSIIYETPHRIAKVLQRLAALDPKRPLCIARELTKKFEECLFGDAGELLAHFQAHPPRGEMVLLI